MRGEVEIWRGDELLSRESNLIVDGAGATIADIMTISPSLSGIESPVPALTQVTASAILDASNYRVQAISFGKDASAYSLNAHTLPTRRNLFYYSTPSSQTDDTAGEIYWPSEMTVCSAPEVILPTKYEGLSSGIAHALEVIDTSDEHNTSLALSLYANTAESASYLTLSSMDDKWFTYSAYLKMPIYDAEFYPYPFTTTVSQLQTHFKMQIGAVGFDSDTGVGKARSATNINWSTSGDWSDPSSVTLNYNSDLRGGSPTPANQGYDPGGWQENGGVEDAGNGWYRVWTSCLAPVSGTSSIDCSMWPVGYESSPSGETSGGVYYFGAQLELGRWPTDVQFNTQGFRATNWDLSGSCLNRGLAGEVQADKGTVRVVPPKDAAGLWTSSYAPDGRLSSPPNPESTRLEDNNTSLFQTSSTTSGFNIGQNLNVVAYREASGLPAGPVAGITTNSAEFFNLYTTAQAIPTSGFTYVHDGKQFVTWYNEKNSGAAAFGGDATSATGAIGPQAYFFGCYPEGSSTGGSNYAFVSSLDTSTAYDTEAGEEFWSVIFSGTYNSLPNEASSMDVSGFINMIMSTSPNDKDGYLMSATASGLCMSGGWATDPNSSGCVEYTTTLGAGDLGYSNLYGGIYNMGLWTIDMKETLQARNVPPYSFGPLNNPRKYRLFATKHLTQNLCHIVDRGGATQSGADQYEDLTVKWRIYFT